MAFQIFISYARKDDLPFPPDSSEANGFVSVLVKHLKYQFQQLGGTAPELWRDTRAIKPSDQFDPIIQKAIGDSEVLLVVLSRNWVEREFCLRELELFQKRWAAEGVDGVKSRIVVVAKNHMDPKERPPLLQGQSSYTFYRREEDDAAGKEQEFFRRGKPQDEYHDRVEEVAVDLWGRLRAQQGAGQTKPPPPPPADAKNARAIYLAKPAADMRAAYLRLVDELQQRTYRVVPERDVEIPNDAAATEFVNAALAQAEVSLHLLGEKSGYAPEDAAPIVKLQLARAAARVPATPADSEGSGREFRRIIWAPRVLVDAEGQAAGEGERDPLAVLATFDPQLPTDRVDGDEISKYVDFVIQHLTRTAPQPKTPDKIEANAQVYVDHRVEDTEYAFDFGRALQKRKIQPVFPNFEGDPIEVTAANRDLLRESDAVVVCWANAAEVWARSRFSEFRDWHGMGREKQFTVRGLIAGPPPGQRKSILMELPPRNEIDVILDLTAYPKPVPEALDPLINSGLADDGTASSHP